VHGKPRQKPADRAESAVDAPSLEAVLPSDGDIAFFNEHGYFRSRKLFTDAELACVIAEQDAFYAGKRDRILDVGGWTKEAGDPYELRKNDYSSQQNPLFSEVLVKNPALGAIAARLLGVSGIRLWHDQLLYKPVRPEAARNAPVTAVGWHTDHQYWKTTSHPMITAWIAFTDCTEEMGPIAMIEGSHRFPDNSTELDFFSGDLAGLSQRFNTGGKPVREAIMTLGAGEVTFHHWDTIHGSYPNVSNTDRRAIAVHMQPLDNRFVRRTDPKSGRLHGHANDSRVRKNDAGDPDYTDPFWCPVLWPR
jgi:hypothetical protein